MPAKKEPPPTLEAMLADFATEAIALAPRDDDAAARAALAMVAGEAGLPARCDLARCRRRGACLGTEPGRPSPCAPLFAAGERERHLWIMLGVALGRAMQQHEMAALRAAFVEAAAAVAAPAAPHTSGGTGCTVRRSR